MAHIAYTQCRDTHLHLVWLIDPDLWSVTATSAAALFGEMSNIGDLTERTILTVRIENKHAGFIKGLHQFFDDDTGKITLARASAGNDSQVRADEVSHRKHHRHSVRRTGEQ